MKKIISEQKKNFRILFRNLSSLLLLVLGPLVLILLIGFAYSSQGIHSVNIGAISSDYERLEPAFQNFSYFADILRYDDVETCVNDMALEKVHICLEFGEDFMAQNSEIPTGTIVFYYDNSKKGLSNKIVESISMFFGVQAEKISLESATTIFQNIENMVVYLYDRNKDINFIINESNSIKQDLILRKQKLIEIQEEFTPTYNRLKKAQDRLDDLNADVNESYNEFNDSLAQLDEDLDDLKDTLYLLRQFQPYTEIYVSNNTFSQNLSQLNNQSYFELSELNYSIINRTIMIPELNQSLNISSLGSASSGFVINYTLETLESVDKSLFNFQNKTAAYFNYVEQQKQEFDEAVLLLDQINTLLEADIKASDEYIEKIDSGISNMVNVQKELNASLAELSKLNPELAEKLVDPILENYEPLLPGLENIKAAFPGMLSVIIIFISMLFADIITLSEINSRAFYRNLIAPVNKLLFTSGMVLTNVFVVLFQVSVLLLVAQFSFNINIYSQLIYLIPVIVLLVLLYTCIGMALGILIRSEQSSILTTTFAALSLFLFSSQITPLETMPKIAALIAGKNPHVLAASIFRKILIFNIPAIKTEVLWLLGYTTAAVVIIVFLTKMKIKR